MTVPYRPESENNGQTFVKQALPQILLNTIPTFDISPKIFSFPPDMVSDL